MILTKVYIVLIPEDELTSMRDSCFHLKVINSCYQGMLAIRTEILAKGLLTDDA